MISISIGWYLIYNYDRKYCDAVLLCGILWKIILSWKTICHCVDEYQKNNVKFK